MTITKTASAIKSHKAPRRAGAAGVVTFASGVLAVSEGVLAGGTGEVAAAGALAVSESGLAVALGRRRPQPVRWQSPQACYQSQRVPRRSHWV